MNNNKSFAHNTIHNPSDVIWPTYRIFTDNSIITLSRYIVCVAKSRRLSEPHVNITWQIQCAKRRRLGCRIFTTSYANLSNLMNYPWIPATYTPVIT